VILSCNYTVTLHGLGNPHVFYGSLEGINVFKKKPPRIHLRAILKLGYDMELKAEALYRKLSDKSDNKLVCDVCSFLADEENTHAKNLESIMTHWDQLPEAAFKDLSEVVPESESLVQEMFEEAPDSVEPAALLAFALAQEKKSVRLYEFFEECLNREFVSTHERFDFHDDRRLQFQLEKLDSMVEEEQRHVKLILELLEGL
jgi:rubrerythrin